MTPEAGDITRLLQAWSAGDKQALDDLLPLLYRELRSLAASYIRRERKDHTLQATALVHEAYLRMVDQTQVQSQSRTQFFAIAANLMRQILVHHARRHRAVKRGGGNKVQLNDTVAAVEQPGGDLIALDQLWTDSRSLTRGKLDCGIAVFGGLTEEEIAGVLAISLATVQRNWRIARAQLQHELCSARCAEVAA
jgi:RNA polymerase sigma factor (TIGR02999 family)